MLKFAEEIRSLEVEIESEVKNAETVTHDSCQKVGNENLILNCFDYNCTRVFTQKERELMKQKQNLEERVKYLKTKLGFSTYQ